MPDQPMCRLFKRERLTELMGRTGTGASLTVRALAEATGLPHGTIGSLTSGAQRYLPEDKARRIAAVIGVDFLVLFVPCERAGRQFADISKDPVRASA